MLKAVERHTDSKWVILYVERWLKAPMLMPGFRVNRATAERVVELFLMGAAAKKSK